MKCKELFPSYFNSKYRNISKLFFNETTAYIFSDFELTTLQQFNSG